MWVEPELDEPELDGPGRPHKEYVTPPDGESPISPFDGQVRFSFNDIGDGTDTVDEIRIGQDFRSVAPSPDVTPPTVTSEPSG